MLLRTPASTVDCEATATRTLFTNMSVTTGTVVMHGAVVASTGIAANRVAPTPTMPVSDHPHVHVPVWTPNDDTESICNETAKARGMLGYVCSVLLSIPGNACTSTTLLNFRGERMLDG